MSWTSVFVALVFVIGVAAVFAFVAARWIDPDDDAEG